MSTETTAGTSQQPKELACPDCGGRKFSWILEIVQFGSVSKDGAGNIHEEGYELGEVVGDDIDSSGLFCTGCDTEFDREDLVEVDD